MAGNPISRSTLFWTETHPPVSLPKYFQGRTVTGTVEASPARTFRDVVDRLQIASTIPFTRAAFFALDKTSRDEAKQVPFFTPATFTESPSKRRYEFAQTCNLIFLDIDPEKDKQDGKWVETGRFPAAPFVRNPQALHQALAGFNFAAHTTASSTPQKPRMRLVVEALGIPLSHYPAAVQTVAGLLGLPSVTTESKVAVQPMFLPTLFQDSDVQTEDPMIAHCLDGRAFTVQDIKSGVHTTDGVNGSNGATNGKHLNGHAFNGADASDQIFFLRAPVPEATLDVVREALEKIDPDCSYHEWIDIASALRHQFTPHHGEEAYSLFDQWSARGGKYVDGKETRAKWDSLRASPVGRMPITIRSLLRTAAAQGWNDSKVKDQSFSNVVEWMGTVSSITALMEQGVQKIIAAPQLSATQEGMLVDQLKVHARERFQYRVTASDIRADIKRIRQEVKARERSEDKLIAPPWAKGVLYVSAAQELFRHHTGEKYKAEPFNAVYARHLLPTPQQLQEQGITATPANLSKPFVSPADYALNHLKIPTVYDYAYDPSRPSDIWFVHQGRKYVNTYSPTYPELDAIRAADAGALFQNHLTNLVAEPEYRAVLTDFCAFQVQFPGVKCRWAVLIQGVDGAGKTYFAEAMKAVLGSEHVKLINGDSVKSGFNEWAFGCQFVVLEEVRVVGTNKHEVMNALKPLITNDEVTVNEKFRNARKIKNISNYMMFSNHHDALSLTPGDRRYFVVKSAMQNTTQVLALGEHYFPPLFENLRMHPGALRSYLMDWDISPAFRADGHAPRTKYTNEMITDSASELTATIRQMLLDGDNPLVQYDVVSSKALKDMFLMEAGTRQPSMQAVSSVLREEGYHQVGRHLFGEERHYLWARGGVERACEIAGERFAKGLKNLGMEML